MWKKEDCCGNVSICLCLLMLHAPCFTHFASALSALLRSRCLQKAARLALCLQLPQKRNYWSVFFFAETHIFSNLRHWNDDNNKQTSKVVTFLVWETRLGATAPWDITKHCSSVCLDSAEGKKWTRWNLLFFQFYSVQ